MNVSKGKIIPLFHKNLLTKRYIYVILLARNRESCILTDQISRQKRRIAYERISEMGNSIETFAEFVADLRYEDLPGKVTGYTKELLLDTLGCGVAGVTSDKGKWGIGFARRCYGGQREATVLGYGDRLSVMGAAFANAELINGLDFEAAGLHVPPYVLPGVFALAEAENRSGKDVILASALALEVGTRIARGLIQQPKVVEAGKESGISPVFGPCSAVFGAAAGAAKTAGFGRHETAHAMGMAGVLSPVPSQASMHRDLPVNSGKYLMAGWGAQTGITATELIRAGHRGNLQVLDSEFGYWRFTGQAGWDREKALGGLGEKWEFLTTTPYKRFPCCGMMHGGLECLHDLIAEAGLKPEEIESIHLRLDPTSSEAMFQNQKLDNQIDTQFSVRYNMALMALGIQPGINWQNNANLQNPAVIEMMEKISAGVHPECGPAMEKDSRARINDVTIRARGRTYRKEIRFIKGTVTAGAAMEVSEEERLRKFRDNTLLILPQWKSDRAIECLLHLEKVEQFGEVMELLAV